MEENKNIEIDAPESTTKPTARRRRRQDKRAEEFNIEVIPEGHKITKKGELKEKVSLKESAFGKWVTEKFPDIAAEVLKAIPLTAGIGAALDGMNVAPHERKEVEFMYKQLDFEVTREKQQTQRKWLELETEQIKSEHFVIKFARPLRQYIWTALVVGYFIQGLIRADFIAVPEIVWGLMSVDLGLYTWKRTQEKLANKHI